MAERKKCCLLVEDAPDDALMVQKHLIGHPDYDFAWVENAEDAVRFLERQPPFADAPTARVILLDLRLPGMDGFEFLEWRQGKETYNLLPVLVVAASTLPQDMKRARDLGVKLYITKPVNWTRLGQELSLLAAMGGRPPERVIPGAQRRPGTRQRLTCVLIFPDGKKLSATAAAETEGQEVRFDYAGDTSKLRPLAEKGTLGFLRWYMDGCALNTGAQIDVYVEEEQG